MTRTSSHSSFRKVFMIPVYTLDTFFNIAVLLRLDLKRAILLLFYLLPLAVGSQDSIAYNVQYSSFLGGKHFEQARDMAIDAEGNFYICGGTSSSEFPTTPGVFNRVYNDAGSETVGKWGPMMAFVCKFSREGELIWSTLLGGPNYDRAYAIEVDAEGYVYLGGRAGDDFPTTPGAYQEDFSKKWPTNNLYGHQNGFVAKLSPDGRELIWATYYGSDSYAFFRDIDIDDEGFVYGILNAVKNKPKGIPDDAFDASMNGDYDMVPVKFTPDGSDVVWAAVLGGSGEDKGGPSVRVGPDKSVYVSGGTRSADFPTTSDAAQTVAGGESDVFVTRIAPDGKSLLYSTYFGGEDDEFSETHILTLDHLGQAHVACASRSVNIPTTAGAIKAQKPVDDGLDALLFKLSLDGQLMACTFFGGSEGDGAEGLYVDTMGYFYVGGSASSADLPVTSHAFQSEIGGDEDGFVIKVNPGFDTLLYCSYLGGEKKDAVRAFNVLPDGTIGLSGQTLSDDFVLTDDAYQDYHASPSEWADVFFMILQEEKLSTSQNEVFRETDVKVFPNPARREVSIESSDLIKYVELLDEYRILKMEKQVKPTHSLVLPLEDLPAGEYWLRIITSENDQVVRLLIKL